MKLERFLEKRITDGWFKDTFPIYRYKKIDCVIFKITKLEIMIKPICAMDDIGNGAGMAVFKKFKQ